MLPRQCEKFTVFGTDCRGTDIVIPLHHRPEGVLDGLELTIFGGGGKLQRQRLTQTFAKFQRKFGFVGDKSDQVGQKKEIDR